MKKILFLTFFVFSTWYIQAQEIPNKGAKLVIDEPTLESPSGQVAVSFDVELLRSSRARKARFDVPRVSGNRGIDTVVKETAKDQYTVSLSGENVAPGSYTFVISSNGNSFHQVTGATVTLVVADSKMAD